MATADQILTDEQQGKPPTKSLWERYLDMRAANAEKFPGFWAEMHAMGREALKDVNSTMYQVFFGQPATHGEPGTPLNPTPQEVTEERDKDFNRHQEMLDLAASRGAVHGRERGVER